MDNILDDEELAASMALAAQEANAEPLPIEEPSATEVIPSIEETPVQNIPATGTECTQASKDCCCECDMNTLNIGKYFGTLMESVVIVWRYHLKTNKYQTHKTLNEYYDDALDLIDTIIEDYQGRFGIVSGHENCICDCEKTDVMYLQALRAFTEEGAQKLGLKDISELSSDIDAFLGLLDSTLYKLVNLTENKKEPKAGTFMTFEEFCK